MRNSGQRVTIKRYADCRLYDTSRGAYLTADEAAALADDHDVVVVDARTGEDITDFILTKQRFH